MALNKLPSIPEIEDAAELISLVANSKLYKERMEKLVDIYGKIKAGLDEYGELRDARDATDLANSKLADAKATEARALSMLDKTRQSCDEMLQKSEKLAGEQLANMREQQRVLEDAMKDLDDRRDSLEKTENHLKTQYVELDEQRKIVTQMHHNAVAMKLEYEEKLSKLKALV